MKKPWVIHPFLMALFPGLFFVTYNIGEITLSRVDAIGSLITLPLLSLLFWLILSWIVKNRQKAGLLVSLFLFVIFSYYPVYDTLLRIFRYEVDYSKIFNDVVLSRILLSGSLIITAGLSCRIIKTRKSLNNATRIINVFAAGLVGISLVQLGVYLYQNYPALRSDDRLELIAEEGVTRVGIENIPRGRLPDIYYIVPDRYAGEKSLKEFFGFDNFEFIEYLRKNGFYVAADSYANYPKTSWSLAATLNYEYLDDLSGFYPRGVIDLKPLHKRIKYHKAGNFLRANGYQYIHFGSGDVERTNRSPMADRNIAYASATNLMVSLYEVSIFYYIAQLFDWEYDTRLIHRERILFTFEKLAEMPDLDSDQPKFIFAHLLFPHPPYVFDQNGDRPGPDQSRDEREKYISQLKFSNRKFRELIDQLLTKSPVPPIIILQADEGPLPDRFQSDERNFDWRLATGAELREKFEILNAYYLPGFDYNLLSPGITPINTFRLIFNHYFNAGYELLPDKNYTFVKILYPYEFIEVTERLNE